jgi:gas vesicle protein
MSKFMTGLLLGVGVGLLLAPEKGEDTRESIAETAEDWKKKWYKMMGKAETKIDDLKALLKSEISGLSDDVRSRINTILEEAGSGTESNNAGGESAKSKDQFKPI